MTAVFGGVVPQGSSSAPSRPLQVKALAICHVLEERMREFRDSIPLFADLKDEALRER